MKQLEMKPGKEDRLVFWQTIAIIGATLTAIASIIFSIYQFQAQQQNADLIAHANIKPLLDIRGEYTDESRSLALINYGIGSAIITNVKFTRISDGKWSNCCISDLFNDEVANDYVHTFWSGDSYLEPGGKILLLSVTRDFLENHGLDSSLINYVLESWDAQIVNMTMDITYTDVLGEKQKNLSTRCWGPEKAITT